MIRLLSSMAFLALGLWLFHSISLYQGLLMARGVGNIDDLTKDAPFIMRFIGALGLVIGGAIAFRFKWLGVVFSALGVVCYAVIPVAAIALGAGDFIWKDDAILAAILAGCWLGLVIFAKPVTKE